MEFSLRSPSFRATILEPSPQALHLTTVLEDEENFALDGSDSEAGSEIGSENGPLPVSDLLRRYHSTHDHTNNNSFRRRPSESHLTANKSPSNSNLQPQNDPNSFLNVLVFGLVNVAVSVPCLYGYAGIIYRDPVFLEAMPDLTKLVILSSAIHQLVFYYQSSMTFAISQVQDAGLIFLSIMASTVARNSSSAKEAVATSAVLLSVCTALLGVVVMIVGRFKLASFVSLIPMPVVAGYLAFIGFFCFAAGLGLSCSKDISTYHDLALLNSMDDWILAGPALLTGMLLTLVSRYLANNWKALPITIAAIPMLFVTLLVGSNTSFEEARVDGWLDPLIPSKSFYEVFYRLDFTFVNWAILPKLILTWISMTLLVTFASALDVVAVEMDLGGKELDIDKELETVGLSNIVSGLFGGYTGSYIFSMTIFTRKTNSTTRNIGLILALFELGLFCAPFNLMSYVPRFFFGGTLIFIAFDLMMEWLYAVFFRVSLREYGLVLITFLAITFSEDLVLGILIGSLAAVVNFISLYSVIDPVVTAPNKSNVLRDYEARKILYQFADPKIISLKLHGFLFFGSTTLLLSRVREFINEDQEAIVSRTRRSSLQGSAMVESSPLLGDKKMNRSSSTNDVPTTLYSTMLSSVQHVPEGEEESDRRHQSEDLEANGELISRALSADCLPEIGPSISFSQLHPAKALSRFLVLDFAHVTNIDATAASTGLKRITMLAEAHQVRVIFCHLAPKFEDLFRMNHVLGDSVVVKQTLNDGLDYCESELLEQVRRNRQLELVNTRVYSYPNEPKVPEILFHPHKAGGSEEWKRAEKKARASLAVLVDTFFGWGKGKPSLSKSQSHKLASYFVLMPFLRNQMIFDIHEETDYLFVVLSGEVVLYKPSMDWIQMTRHERAANKGEILFGVQREPLQRARYGSMIGDLSFTLQEKRTFGAIAEQDTCLYALSRNRFAQMERDDPQLAVGLFKMIGRSLGMTLSSIQQLSMED